MREAGSREGKCPRTHTEKAYRPQLEETLFLHKTHFAPRHTQNISSWGRRTCRCRRVKQPSSFGLFLLLPPFFHEIPTTMHGIGTNPNTEQHVLGIYLNFKISSLTYKRVLSAPRLPSLRVLPNAPRDSFGWSTPMALSVPHSPASYCLTTTPVTHAIDLGVWHLPVPREEPLDGQLQMQPCPGQSLEYLHTAYRDHPTWGGAGCILLMNPTPHF